MFPKFAEKLASVACAFLCSLWLVPSFAESESNDGRAITVDFGRAMLFVNESWLVSGQFRFRCQQPVQSRQRIADALVSRRTCLVEIARVFDRPQEPKGEPAGALEQEFTLPSEIQITLDPEEDAAKRESRRSEHAKWLRARVGDETDEFGYGQTETGSYILAYPSVQRPSDMPLLVACQKYGRDPGDETCRSGIELKDFQITYFFSRTEYPQRDWEALDQRVIGLLGTFLQE